MAGITSPNRLTGFSGTLDTESVIKKLMDAERAPLNNIYKKKQLALWKREDYMSMNTKMLSFRNTVNELRFESSFEKVTATSSDTSVLAITSSGPNVSTSNIAVTQLAESAMLIGKVPGAASTVASAGKITINSVNVEFSAQATVDSIVKDINSKSSDTGVRASYDQNSGALYLTSTATGKNSLVEISGDVGLLGFSTLKDEGEDAVYTVNGVTLNSSTNSVLLNGNQVTLKGKGQATIGAVTDRSGIVDKIKAFVEQYNALIDTFATAATTRKNRDYAPLTDQEKEAMTDKQIEQWEKKAREGTLYNDSILKDALSSTRIGLNTPLNVDGGQISMLSQIGITVKSSYTENGKLEIDEAKLNAAINNNFDEVKQLFVTGSSKTEVNGKSNLGIGDRVYNILNNQIDAIKDKIGSSGKVDNIDDSIMGKELKEFNTQEARWKSKLLDIENRYYKQFAAMEQALQKLNNQSSMFASMG
ncbi:flagellar filament capping protein FliD [Paenibacillus sp. ISL-20]|uniref:flagellar filament capping protein FliD n=1 Tax=Paenibacillus sp. ISL-20 TaxID=2819163 RepID=UPI001BE68839|nr:flagellar filament capping protein FliD [Paenibacillus sp. ISL-20]MBT2764789.1 flagellar filament capping protein FliD [Paenibacillus sp. ISL-20]